MLVHSTYRMMPGCSSKAPPEWRSVRQTLEQTTMVLLLPDEILVNIFKEITHGPTKDDTRERNILSVQLANRQCLRVATEILYRSIHIKNHPNMHRFLHTILSASSSYAGLVTELKLERTSSVPGSGTPPIGESWYTYSEEMIRVAQAYNLSTTTIGGFGRSAPEEQISVTKVLILLCSLPQLEKFQISISSHPHELVSRFTTIQGQTSAKLRVLELDLSNAGDGYRAVSLYPLFILPPTKTVILRNIPHRLWADEFGTFSEPPEILGSPGVRELAIWNARLSTHSIAQLLDFMPEAQEFKYQDAGAEAGLLGYGYLYPSLQPALDQVSHTLVVLCIAWQGAGSLGQDDIQLNLSHFKKLKDITIELDLLLGGFPNHQNRLHDTLPVSLEVLSLRMVAWGSKKEAYISVIRDLLSCKDMEVVPRLSLIYTGYHDPSLLRELAEVKGVTLGQEPSLSSRVICW